MLSAGYILLNVLSKNTESIEYLVSPRTPAEAAARYGPN